MLRTKRSVAALVGAVAPVALIGAALGGVNINTSDDGALPSAWPGLANTSTPSFVGTNPTIVSGNNNQAGSPDNGQYLSGGVPTANPSVNQTVNAFTVESETFTPTSNFTLGAISMIIVGGTDPYPPGNDVSLHLFASPTGSNGSALTGSSTGYTLNDTQLAPGPSNPPTDMLGSGNGLAFTFNGSPSAEIIEFDFTGLDEVALTAGTTYAFELWSDVREPTFYLERVGSVNGSSSGMSTYSGGQVYSATTKNGVTDSAGFTPDDESDQSTIVRGQVSGSARNLIFGVYPVLTWNNNGGTGDGVTWDTTNQNWNSSAPATYVDGTTVQFNDSNNGNYNVTLNSTVKPNSITVNNNNGNYVINGTGSIGDYDPNPPMGVNADLCSIQKYGTGTLTIANTGTNTYTGGTSVFTGEIIEGARGSLPANSAVTIGGTGSMQLAPNTDLPGGDTLSSLAIQGNTGNTLDITNNHFILSYGATDPKSQILGDLVNGSNGGKWNGAFGIISSTAASNPNYGIGYSDGADGIDSSLSSGQIEVAYVQYGDITLSGLVNAQDFSILAHNFGQVVTGGWEQGDFTYSGTVNGNDFSLLAANFGHTETGEDTPMPASDWAAIDAFAAANDLSADVPEPATLGLLAIGSAGLLVRRRRST